ncbi:MAG: hypothetical protein JXA17_01285 [Dehalococcoidales bacterium]|nr:hypothetical protein [Dehalococcoidales bacterium]
MKKSAEKEIYQIDIPVEVDVAWVLKWMHPGRTSARVEEIARELVEEARKIARPRAVYRISHPRVIDKATTEIDGVVFKSKVLSKLLTGPDTIIPYIATIGKELDALNAERGEMMKGICLEVIKTLVLGSASEYLTEYVKKKYNMPRIARMNPGSLEDWPITEQRAFLSLFDDVEKRIGVTLSSGGVLKPTKSVSSIIFPNESGFVTCQICPKPDCPTRRAKYNPELHKQYLA